jgi:Cys-tRNA(Pro)/Cys-tRNA(Cys) deacylase
LLTRAKKRKLIVTPQLFYFAAILMTPAVLQLQKSNIAFNIHQYSHDENSTSFGLEAAEKLAVEANKVFKTLIVDIEKGLAVAIIPVSHQLSLKKLAKALNVKKGKMAQARDVEKTTGYVLGGVSPLGQKKRLPTVIDSSLLLFESVYVSGGKRGLEIELSPDSLQALCQAKMVDLIA